MTGIKWEAVVQEDEGLITAFHYMFKSSPHVGDIVRDESNLMWEIVKRLWPPRGTGAPMLVVKAVMRINVPH